MAPQGGYLRVVNWEKHQHYKDRNPPWIKLHNSILEDPVLAALPDAAKAHVMAIWLLASRLDNRIPADPAFIAKRINATAKVDLKLLIHTGFLESHPETPESASNLLATCYTPSEVAYTEKRQRRGETETEESGGADAPRIEPPPTPATPEEATAKALEVLGTAHGMAKGWNREAAEDFKAAYHANPTDQFMKQVQKVAQVYGWTATRPALRRCMEDTPEYKFLNIPKVLPVAIEQAQNGHHQETRAGPGTVNQRSLGALERFVARRTLDAEGSAEGDSVREVADKARRLAPPGGGRGDP